MYFIECACSRTPKLAIIDVRSTKRIRGHFNVLETMEVEIEWNEALMYEAFIIWFSEWQSLVSLHILTPQWNDVVHAKFDRQENVEIGHAKWP